VPLKKFTLLIALTEDIHKRKEKTNKIGNNLFKFNFLSINYHPTKIKK